MEGFSIEGRVARWVVNKLNKLELMIRDRTEIGRKPLLHDLFFKNSPRIAGYEKCLVNCV